MEAFVQTFSSLDPFWVYVVVAGIAYLENIFPPFPSDVVIVAAGSLVGLGKVEFAIILAAATVGSTGGFMTMYKIGDWFGDRILEKGKIRFIPVDQVHKVESWFKLHGYWLIVANRFLAGTRAVVSFFAGLSELPFWFTTFLSLISALVWNTILVFAGRKLGENWRQIVEYLEGYGKIVTILLIIVVAVYVGYRLYKRAPGAGSPPTSSDE
ncbi:MAG: DedA family protein [Bacteroidota bacterium]